MVEHVHGSVSSYEAKTHLAALLRRVEAGESITITRRGTEIAVIHPPEAVQLAKMRAAVARMRAYWEKAPADKKRRRKYISRSELHEGHKY